MQFNLDGLMRGDYESRMEGYAIARQNGWMSTNDIRELENLNPVSEEEGGNALSGQRQHDSHQPCRSGRAHGACSFRGIRRAAKIQDKITKQDAPEEETKPEENEPSKRGRRKSR